MIAYASFAHVFEYRTRSRLPHLIYASLTEIDKCQINKSHLVSLQYSSGFPLIRIIAAKRASAQRSLTNRHDEEIASITDFSDDGEKDMCVIFTLILLQTIGWTCPISDSVEYLFVLQQTRRKCENAKGNPRYSSSLQKRLTKHPRLTSSDSSRCSLPSSVGMRTQWSKR